MPLHRLKVFFFFVNMHTGYKTQWLYNIYIDTHTLVWIKLYIQIPNGKEKTYLSTLASVLIKLVIFPRHKHLLSFMS